MRLAFFPYHGSSQSWPKMTRSPNMLYLSLRRARNEWLVELAGMKPATEVFFLRERRRPLS
jgi:hypothetical protein